MGEEDVEDIRAFPEEIRDKWPQIREAVARLRDWFIGYTDGASEVRSRFPEDPPTVADSYQLPDPKGLRGDPKCGIIGYRIGSFLIFRAPKARQVELEIEQDADNERLIDDGDHVIVTVLL